MFQALSKHLAYLVHFNEYATRPSMATPYVPVQSLSNHAHTDSRTFAATIQSPGQFQVRNQRLKLIAYPCGTRIYMGSLVTSHLSRAMADAY